MSESSALSVGCWPPIVKTERGWIGNALGSCKGHMTKSREHIISGDTLQPFLQTPVMVERMAIKLCENRLGIMACYRGLPDT